MKRLLKFIIEYLTQSARRRKERKEKQYSLCVLCVSANFAFTTPGLISSSHGETRSKTMADMFFYADYDYDDDGFLPV